MQHLAQRLEVNPLPIFLNVADRPCLVVGAGAVATRKVELLLEAGARVTVVAQDIGPEVRRLAEACGRGVEPVAVLKLADGLRRQAA
jgi:siroheme synthase (precorrin-2 oxidase/ferrochelatase)